MSKRTLPQRALALPALTVTASLALCGVLAAPATAAQPAAPAGPLTGPAAGRAATTPLALASYDRRTGKARLTAPRAARGPHAPAAETAGVRPGQLIASPPSAAAPRGALLAITAVEPAAGGQVEVSTRPATIAELLGDADAALHKELDPRAIQVKPLLKDLKVSYTKRADGADGHASAALELDADTSVPLPGGASASLSGSVEVDPAVNFSYTGTKGILRPQQAKVGLDLGAHADWHISAGLSASATPVRIPLAKLSASPVLMVGQLPVVVNLDLTLAAEIGADGSVTLDTQQDINGSWSIEGSYTKGEGWKTATTPLTVNASPVRAKLSGNASVRTGLAADASVALYDTVGLKASVKPYLRTSVNGTVTVDSSGAAPVVQGSAGLYGGFDLTGALMARIAVFGTPLFEKDIPLGSLHREWTIAERTTG
ncbi:hypothetical protein [Streptomyces sp. NRRL S-87]|uniref:hypothetical protein n=1 Tax=Streptomyces sp. NRRL S-87 TaxID=1463920 RepID=UPI00068CE6FF|nr:hypothetical protein [Streptomyces sp. NRRL S-87]